MAPGEYTDEEYARGLLIDKLQVATCNRAVVREKIHTGHYASVAAAAEELALARAGVDRAEQELFDFDVKHPCTRR